MTSIADLDPDRVKGPIETKVLERLNKLAVGMSFPTEFLIFFAQELDRMQLDEVD